MPHPQNTQSVEEVLKEFHRRWNTCRWQDSDDTGFKYTASEEGDETTWDEDRIANFLRTALITAIESERNRILKLLPPEKELYFLKDKPDKSDESKAWSNVNRSGYNDYRREVLQILNPKE